MKTQIFFFQPSVLLTLRTGETKTPKIIGCCRANFAFLPALKIGTFRGKWTLEWLFKKSHFARLALHFLNPWSNCFFFACFLTMLIAGNAKKGWLRAQNNAKNNFLPPCFETDLPWTFFFPYSSLNNNSWTLEKTRFSTSCEHREWGLNKTELGGCRVKSWPNVASKQLQSPKILQQKKKESLLGKQTFPFLFETGS